jgi:two-component system, OmpR family, phosphate regulon sensor histidine kinase PhoR
MTGRSRAGVVVGGATFVVALSCVAVAFGIADLQQRRAIEERLATAAQALAPMAEPLFSTARREANAVVDGWAAASGLRITLIRGNGTVHAESTTVADLVSQMESHATRPEVREALAQGRGLSRRRSRTTNRVTTYFALRLGPPEAPLGFLRVAWQGPVEAPPVLPVLGAIVVALVAGILARSAVSHTTRVVALHLGSWTELPDEADPETIAEDADRRFRAAAEESNREVEATRAALAEVSEGVVLLDREGVVRFANPASIALLGDDLAVGRALVEANRAPELLAAVEAVRSNRETRHTTFTAPKGAEIAVRACPVPHPILTTAVVLRDVRGEKQLERARRALVADLAHELRTPLTVLGGLAEELRDVGVDAPALDTLERQVRRLQTFAEDLEELADAEAGRLLLRFEDVDVATVAREAAAELAPAAGAARVTIALPEGPLPLITDRVRLGQVLTNLLDNAIRYNRPGGRVVVSGAITADTLQITVEDTGRGIPAEEIPLVFQRFYQVRRGSGEGSGLGLAIVKHLVRALGGTAQLASVEDEGTTVTISLPRIQPPSVGAQS